MAEFKLEQWIEVTDGAKLIKFARELAIDEGLAEDMEDAQMLIPDDAYAYALKLVLGAGPVPGARVIESFCI